MDQGKHAQNISQLKKADGDEIDKDVEINIKQVGTLLTKKKDIIEEERLSVLKELQQKRQELKMRKDTITKEIQRATDELNRKREEVAKRRKQFFQSDKPRDAQVSLNVGGWKFKTVQGTLTCCHGSTLSAMFSLGNFPGYKDLPDKDTCFIDRNRDFFDKILDFLRSGASQQPSFHTKAEEIAFRKEADYFGLTSWIFPPKHPVPPITMVEEVTGGAKVYSVRFDPRDIKKDSWFSSPDFLHTQEGYGGDRWRILFTERDQFLSVFAHNVDAGLMLFNGEEKSFRLRFTLRHKDHHKSDEEQGALSVTKTVEHTFTRRCPDIGFNYFQLLHPLTSLRHAGFLHEAAHVPGKKEEEHRSELVFDLAIGPSARGHHADPVHEHSLSHHGGHSRPPASPSPRRPKRSASPLPQAG